MDPANQRTGSVLDPEATIHQFGCTDYIDVDKSSAHPGYIFVSGDPTFCFGGSSETVDIFLPSGEYLTSIKAAAFDGQANGVGIDDEGYVYVNLGTATSQNTTTTTSMNSNASPPAAKPDPESPLGSGFYYSPCCLRAKPDNTGAVWLSWGSALFDDASPEAFGKVEANQFVKDLTPNRTNPNLTYARTSPYLFEGFPERTCPEKVAVTSNTGNPPAAATQCNLKGSEFDVDLTTNDLYDVENNAEYEGPNPENPPGGKVTPYSQGVPGDPVHQNAPSFGPGKCRISSSTPAGHVGIDYGPTGEISITDGPKVTRSSSSARASGSPTSSPNRPRSAILDTRRLSFTASSIPPAAAR